MSADVPTKEPIRVAAGDTFIWQRSFSDYPASDGWTLTYSLVTTSNKIAITASADGNNFLVSVAATTTAAYNVGTYDQQAYVTLSSERYQVGSGVIEILENFATQSSAFSAGTTPVTAPA